MSNPPRMSDDELVARAKHLVHDSDRVGGFALSKGFAAAVTAYMAPLLCIIVILVSIPPTAHVFGQPQAEPIALLGLLLFGPAAYGAFHRHRSYVWARRYLKARGIKD